ncbi:SulP family inorganic anion transporter [Ulvibacter antarcticus]|uniref:MFS superfamily sulfate permease-like transporter n=1 Tax=Ulvibacter antarcticus TaxID=442714 RepID=A0A3L9Z6Y6_9FLAO|nr:SulP family inorganic anion transporter [Ulvibacter antarcticus]RMA66035.1 MFS superfamily sulfate permease-like transporter [Ulvibacter antarcticus]
MSKKQSSIKVFLSTLPKNIFSGFVVSLIALPLGLGLAMASEAPPIAGIITAVVGGLVVSILGGSHITITGPGNGMVGVVLVAVTTLGLEGAYAAIICSGVVMILLGFLRMGKLADFFPSSAIQGMLAAIGLIILGKQFHIMLANKLSLEASIDYLIAIPETLLTVIHFQDKGLIYAAIVGVISLLIMIFYARIRNKYLQLIPAPMWIVIITIGFSYYYEYILQQPNPISPIYMLSGIPSANEIISDLPTPQFGLFATIPFWASVFALTLIASIESLLSIKAVDKLDPLKRRSNVNRDLKALGLATIGSGFLGGLNVVTVIARSSVNANNGGTNRSSNMAHALFLILFIALFSTQLTRIPLPALMAILVYTGYKLASPKLIRKIFSVGKEQLIIFFVTLFVTLFVDLITGIAAGVLVTFILHILVNRSFQMFFRNVLKPNVLMYREENGNYYLSVKHFCSFLNYYKLKEKLNAIPESADVVVDFSICEFVDHTVMENLHGYQDLFLKRGGHFELIGLDLHGADSNHPFAQRRMIPDLGFLTSNLTKRQKTLQEIADNFNLNYESEKTQNSHFLDNFHFFRTKKVENVYNRLFNTENTFRIFDINYSEGEFIAKENVKTTMLHIKLNHEIPQFTLDREGFLERVYALAGFADIPIHNHSDFSKRFYLLGENRTEIQMFFSDKIVQFFESNPYYHVESNGASLLVFGKERVAGVKEIKALYDFGRRLREVIP